MSKSHETLWDDVLKAALLGSGRQPVALPPSSVESTDGIESSILDEALAKLGSDDTGSESALLSAVSVLTLYRGAGQLPVVSQVAMPSPCPPDERPPCGAAAGARLSLMLQGQNRQCLPEWLHQAAGAKLRAPEELLPDLLEAGRRESKLRDAITPVLGRRGRWLAALNPAWSDFASEAGEVEDVGATWQTGNKAARLALLRRLRRSDPARARELLASTWQSELPQDRSQFLETFAIAPSMADEPFLEAALDDRRKEVRLVAVTLLARLPESRLSARVVGRVRPLLRLQSGGKLKKLLSGDSIQVTLPIAFDKTMERDGLEEKVPPGAKRIGEKAWWLQQMLAAVPPDIWCRNWGKSPEDIQRAAKRSEWAEPLLQGLRQAAQRHGEMTWLEAFLAEAIQHQKFSADEMPSGLPPARLEALVLDALTSSDGHLFNVQALLAACDHAWSEPFAHAILKAVRYNVSKGTGRALSQSLYWLRYSLKDFALRIPPHLADEAAAGWPVDVSHWDDFRPAVDEFLSLLYFRRDMLCELQSAG